MASSGQESNPGPTVVEMAAVNLIGAAFLGVAAVVLVSRVSSFGRLEANVVSAWLDPETLAFSLFFGVVFGALVGRAELREIHRSGGPRSLAYVAAAITVMVAIVVALSFWQATPQTAQRVGMYVYASSVQRLGEFVTLCVAATVTVALGASKLPLSSANDDGNPGAPA
jgi:hypothetical protein